MTDSRKPESRGQSREEESDDTGRFLKFSDSEKLASTPLRTIYKGFDREDAVEVAWVEYPHIPKQALANFDALRKRLLNLNHRNIMKYKHAWVDEAEDRVVLITHWTSSGNLAQYVAKAKPQLKVLQKWCKQILEGLSYLHSLDPPIVHLALRCDNYYIRSNVGLIKIGGLEWHHLQGPRDIATFTTHTAAFMAPELFHRNVGPSADIYSFGMSLLQMITRQIPYIEHATTSEMWEHKLANVPPLALAKVTDEAARRFIEKCIAPVGSRPTADELLKDEWMADVPSLQIHTSSQLTSTPLSAIPEVKRHDEPKTVPVPHHAHVTAAAAAHPPAAPTQSAPLAVAHRPPLVLRTERTPMAMATADDSIKVYFPTHDEDTPELIRVDLSGISSVDELVTLLREEFELDDNFHFRIKYLDRDGELVTLTSRGTLSQIRKHALSLQIAPMRRQFRQGQPFTNSDWSAPRNTAARRDTRESQQQQQQQHGNDQWSHDLMSPTSDWTASGILSPPSTSQAANMTPDNLSLTT